MAEAISKSLSEGGAQVDGLPMAAVKELALYQAAVAGSAIQSNRWLPEAVLFVQTHQAELKHKPCAVFLVCMTLAMLNGEKYRPIRGRIHGAGFAFYS